MDSTTNGHHHQMTSRKLPWSRTSKSESDLYQSTSFKSYENITHTNYVQMVNSMINGAISEVADPEYVEYVRRHLQGLFENFAPVLMKSKSNEEMAMASPSRDAIAELVNQSIPKSVSLDFRLLEENGRDEDGMDFSKFGLGIDNESRDDDAMEARDSTPLSQQHQKMFAGGVGLLIDDLMQCDDSTEVGSRTSFANDDDDDNDDGNADLQTKRSFAINQSDSGKIKIHRFSVASFSKFRHF